MSVQSVTRAIDLLKTLAVNRDGLGVTELAKLTDLHKSTAFRLLSTLEAAKVINRTAEGKTYAVADGFAALFDNRNKTINLLSLAKPYLLQLSSFSGEDAGLALLEGDNAHFVDQAVADRQQAVQVRNWIDTCFPLHEVAAGRAMLAFRGASVQQRYVERYCGVNSAESKILSTDLQLVQKQGYAWLFDAHDTGLTAVAAPIFDSNGSVVAALCIFGPNFRFPPSEQQTEISQRIVTLSQQLSQKLNAGVFHARKVL